MSGSSRWPRVAGFVAGLAIVAVLVGTWGVPRGDGRLGADVTFVTGPTGELAIPSGPVLRATAMEPGDRATGIGSVRNQTGRALGVRIRALPSIGDLDRVLEVGIHAGGRVVYAGPLGGLRTWSAPFRLGSGQRVRLSILASLAGGSGDASRGRIDDVVLQFHSVAVGGAA